MPLANRNIVPPGGFLYEQKYSRGIKKFSAWGPLIDLAREVADFRRGNSLDRQDVNEVLDDIDEFNANRLGNDPRWCRAEKKTSFYQRFQASPQHLIQVVKAAGDAVSKLASGARILKDWLGDGATPVNRDLAQARTNICLACPQNQESHGLLHLTTAIATAIVEELSEKQRLNLTVEGETDLHTCAVCKCVLPLKVWVPISKIAPETIYMDELPANCWIPKEAAVLKSSNHPLIQPSNANA